MEDPHRLFNAGFDGGTRRAIDFHEDDKVDEAAKAVELNTAGA